MYHRSAPKAPEMIMKPVTPKELNPPISINYRICSKRFYGKTKQNHSVEMISRKEPQDSFGILKPHSTHQYIAPNILFWFHYPTKALLFIFHAKNEYYWMVHCGLRNVF